MGAFPGSASTPMIVAVNLSPLDLFDAELPSYISGLLSESSLPPSWLVLEITETAIMRDPAYALKILRGETQPHDTQTPVDLITTAPH